MVDKDHELPSLLPEGAAWGSEPLLALFHPQEIMLGHTWVGPMVVNLLPVYSQKVKAESSRCLCSVILSCGQVVAKLRLTDPTSRARFFVPLLVGSLVPSEQP